MEKWGWFLYLLSNDSDKNKHGNNNLKQRSNGNGCSIIIFIVMCFSLFYLDRLILNIKTWGVENKFYYKPSRKELENLNFIFQQKTNKRTILIVVNNFFTENDLRGICGSSTYKNKDNYINCLNKIIGNYFRDVSYRYKEEINDNNSENYFYTKSNVYDFLIYFNKQNNTHENNNFLCTRDKMAKKNYQINCFKVQEISNLSNNFYLKELEKLKKSFE